MLPASDREIVNPGEGSADLQIQGVSGQVIKPRDGDSQTRDSDSRMTKGGTIQSELRFVDEARSEDMLQLENQIGWADLKIVTRP